MSTAPSGHARVAVVGGGVAAATVVATLVRAGVDGIHVVTSEPRLPYDRTTVSKGLLTGHHDEPPVLFSDVFADDAVTVHHDTATALDRDANRIALAAGTDLSFDQLVLATGAAPWIPPLAGVDHPQVTTMRTAADGQRVRTWLGDATTDDTGHLVVIGGGIIGMEVAAAARDRGTDVTVLEAGDRPMARVGPAGVVGVLVDEHRGRGVSLHTEVLPQRIDDGDGRLTVTCADGTTVVGDHVLVATGIRPRTELASAAGLAVDDGIVVDELLRTSRVDVYAAGDVARVVDDAGGTSTRHESWTPAMAMGQALGRTLTGTPTPWRDVPWSWSDQYDLRFQAAGWPDRATRWVKRGSSDDLATALTCFGLDAHARLCAAVGISRGPAVGRVVRGSQAAIAAGLVIDDAQLADPDVDLRRLARERT